VRAREPCREGLGGVPVREVVDREIAPFERELEGDLGAETSGRKRVIPSMRDLLELMDMCGERDGVFL
jgi:hypothetical protein